MTGWESLGSGQRQFLVFGYATSSFPGRRRRFYVLSGHPGTPGAIHCHTRGGQRTYHAPLPSRNARQWRMAAELSRRLAQAIERELLNLRALTDDQASLSREPGKWCPKEELGHLIDSASNNHLRFVGGALEPQFRGPGYAQNEWVKLHGYSTMRWEKVVDFWAAYNNFLARLIERIPDSQLETECFIAAYRPVTLHFLIDDYILHMQHHLDQLLRREIITQYPGAQLSKTL